MLNYNNLKTDNVLHGKTYLNFRFLKTFLHYLNNAARYKKEGKQKDSKYSPVSITYEWMNLWEMQTFLAYNLKHITYFKPDMVCVLGFYGMFSSYDFFNIFY